jgi:hypothetical protein
MMDACLATLAGTEYHNLEIIPRDMGGGVITAACEAIDPHHRDQYQALGEWLEAIKTEFGPQAGWLTRYALTLLQENTIIEVNRDGTWVEHSRTTRARAQQFLRNHGPTYRIKNTPDD